MKKYADVGFAGTVRRHSERLTLRSDRFETPCAVRCARTDGATVVLTLAASAPTRPIFSLVAGCCLGRCQPSRTIGLRSTSATAHGVGPTTPPLPEIQDLRERSKTLRRIGDFSTSGSPWSALGDAREVRGWPGDLLRGDGAAAPGAGTASGPTGRPGRGAPVLTRCFGRLNATHPDRKDDPPRCRLRTIVASRAVGALSRRHRDHREWVTSRITVGDHGVGGCR
jgi:hypothetical protein